jgi:hypothetical protein
MWIVNLILGLFGVFLKRKTDVAKEAGRLEESNDQLREAAKEKDDAIEKRREAEAAAKSQSDVDAFNRLR